MKRYLRMSLWMALLTLILVIGVLAVPTSAAEVASGTCGANLTWILDDTGTLTISGTGNMDNWELLSDEERPWYSHISSITRVVIEEGVTSIGKTAFYDFHNLQSVSIADSVNSINTWAFNRCSSLESIAISKNVARIGDYVFTYCDSLQEFVVDPDNTRYSSNNGILYDKSGTSLICWPNAKCPVVIPSTITSIGYCAFYSNDAISRIVIPSNVTSIGSYSFYSCRNLEEVTIQGNANFGESTFDNCNKLFNFNVEDSDVYSSIDGVLYNKDQTALIKCPIAKKHINIPDTVKALQDYAFDGCNQLREITLPDSIQEIGRSAFSVCGSLKTITLPAGIKSIDDFCFSNCWSLVSIRIPESVESIGYWSFYACRSLGHVLYEGTEVAWNNIDMSDSQLPDDVVFSYEYEKGTDYHVYDNNKDTHCNICDLFRTVGCVGQKLGIEITTNADNSFSVTGEGSEYVTAIFTGQSSITIGSYSQYCKGYTLVFSKPGDYELYFIQDNTGVAISFDAYITEHNWIAGKCDACGMTDSMINGVTRLAGADRIVTSFLVADQLKAQMGIEKFDSIIVASGKTFADALPGSYLAAVKNAPILLTLPKDKFVEQTAEYIKTNLVENGTVYILGGESAVPSSMETALTGINVKRVAGADRFGTNLAILKEAGVKAGDEILVCTAREFADSLSAAATGKPILLVYKKLTDDQKSYLETLIGNTFCVVGGTSAVPTSFEEELATYGEVTRLAGKDRLDTSVLVAEKYFPDATTSVVAYGWDFPDGLCGGSLAYALDAPLILTHSKTKLAQFTADYTTKAGIKDGFVLGGDGLVSDEATRAIFGMGNEPITILK